MKSSTPDTIKANYIVDKQGKKTGVILDIKFFNALLEKLEDLYDIAEAEKVLQKKEGTYSIEEVEKILFEDEKKDGSS